MNSFMFLKNIAIRLTTALLLLFILNTVAAGDIFRVGFSRMDGFQQIDQYGEKSGMGYEFLQQIATFGDWTYEYSGYDTSWADMLKLLESGHIDILNGVQKTPGREAKFAFSRLPSGHAEMLLTTRKDNQTLRYQDFANWPSIRVGMLEKVQLNDDFKAFADSRSMSYKPVMFKTMNDMLNALLKTKSIDAVLSCNIRTIHDEKVIATCGRRDFYIMTVKSKRHILERIDAAIDRARRNDPEFVERLWNKYFSSGYGHQIMLTPEEKDFIAQAKNEGKIFTAVISPDKVPFSFLDRQGNPAGIMWEISSEIISRSGLPVKILPTSNRVEYRELIRNATPDLILDCWAHPPYAEKTGYKLTAHYLTTSMSAIYLRGREEQRRTIAGISDAPELNHVVRLIKQCPVIVTTYDDFAQALKAIRHGRQDMLIVPTLSAEYAVFQDDHAALSSATVVGAFTQFSVAVNAAQSHLLTSIIDKAARSINHNLVYNALDRYSLDKSRDFSLLRYIYARPLLMAAIPLTLLAILASFSGYYFFSRRRAMRTAAIFARLPLRYLVADAKGKIYQYELDACSGLRSSKAKFKKIDDIPYPPVTDIIKEKINEAISQDRIVTAHYEFMEEKRSAIVSRLPYNLFRAETAVWISQDTSELQASRQKVQDYARKLENALCEAEEANRAKTIFLSTMSHEIRTPLNAVLGFAELLNDPKLDWQKQQEYIGNIAFAGQALLDLINDVLDLSKLESGNMVFHYEPTNINNMCREICAVFTPKLNSKGLKMVVDTDSVPRVHIDKQRIRQVLFNLVGNAVKFTQTGSIGVKCSFKPTLATKGILTLHVSDTGIGIDERDQKYLFDSFVQAKNIRGTKMANQGTGLGLAISKRLIEQMGGKIRIKSKPGFGSTFTVTLPEVGYDLNTNEDAPHDDMTEISEKLSVLLVDDVTLNLKVMEAMLNRIGVRCTSTSAAVQALDLALKNDYDAILTDLWMPEMNGVELALKIRASKPDCRIIAITEDTESEETFNMKVFDDTMTKPVTIGKLRQILSHDK